MSQYQANWSVYEKPRCVIGWKCMKQLKRQGRVNRDPKFIKRIYALEDIEQGLSIMQALSLYRLMTNQQVGELLFRDWLTIEGKYRSDKMFQRKANESLNRLIDSGYLTRTPVTLRHRETQNKYMTHLNLLTRQGAKLLVEEHGLETRWASSLKSNFHQSEPNHLVAINDTLIHLTRAVWTVGGQITHQFTDAELKNRFHGLVPDFLVVVAMPDGRECPLFGEIDRGSMTGQSASASVRDWQKKIEGYGAYIRHEYREHEFLYSLDLDPKRMAHPLVLTLTAKTGRLDNLRATTHRAGGGTSYWHTTLPTIYNEWLSMTQPIWFRPEGSEPVNLIDHLEPQSRPPD